MSAEEEATAFANKEENKVKILNSNFRFVFSIAKCYANGEQDILDYNNAGVIGMYAAFDSFDIEKGVRFISYAVHYIRLEMGKLCTQMSLVQRSNEHKIGSKVTKFQAKFLQENMRNASDDEVCDYLASEFGFDVKYKNEIHAISTTSLSDMVGEDSTIEETGEVAMRTASVNDYENEVEREESERRIEIIMSVLPIRDRAIFKKAIFDGWDYESIGNEYGMSDERARQIVKAFL